MWLLGEPHLGLLAVINLHLQMILIFILLKDREVKAWEAEIKLTQSWNSKDKEKKTVYLSPRFREFIYSS